jgi:hypothetical protein
VLAFVLSVVALAPEPAFAHAGSPNPYFEHVGNREGVTWRNPHFQVGEGFGLTHDYQQLTCYEGPARYGVQVRLYGVHGNGTLSNGYNVYYSINTRDSSCSPGTLGHHENIAADAGGTLGAGPWDNYQLRYVRTDTGDVVLKAGTIEPVTAPDAPTNLQVTGVAPGGKLLTYDQVAALAIKSGWSTRQAQIEAVAVARAESSFRTKAVSYTGCCHGLWQVNSAVHGTTGEEMFDPYKNGRKAFAIYADSGSWQPWEAFTNGAYQQYMDEAAAAVDRQRLSPDSAYVSIANSPSSSAGSVSLGWTTNCATCAYVVSRSSDGGASWSQVGSTANLSWTDSNAPSGLELQYRVKAVRDGLDSTWSTPVAVTVTADDPSEGCDSLCGGGAGDPSAGTTEEGESVSCGLNVFCWIKAALKWAFVPSDGVGAIWDEFRTAAADKFPFSLGIAAFDLIHEVNERMRLVGQNSYGGETESDLLLCPPDLPVSPEGCFQDWVHMALGPNWPGHIRAVITLALWVLFAWWVWGEAQRFFGRNTSSASAGEDDDE